MSVQIILRKMMQTFHFQKQPFRGALKKSCSENMQQIYRRTPKPKCEFAAYFRTAFLKNTPGRLIL